MDTTNITYLYDWLLGEVTRLGFNPNEVRIGGSASPGDGDVGFDYRDGKWCVYIFERGVESDVAIFDVRRDAVYYFFLKLMLGKGEKSYPAVNFRSMPSE